MFGGAEAVRSAPLAARAEESGVWNQLLEFDPELILL